MRALRLAELREVLQGEPFEAWWTALAQARTGALLAGERQRELRHQVELMALRAGQAEGLAEAAAAGAEGAEAAQERHAAEAAALERPGAEGAGMAWRLRALEQGELARLRRAEADRAAAEALERRQRAGQLEAQAEEARRQAGAAAEAVAALLARAEQELGCALGERLLFWRQRDDPRLAFAVPLEPIAALGDAVQLEPLAVFALSLAGGRLRVERAPDGAAPTPGDRGRREAGRSPP